MNRAPTLDELAALNATIGTSRDQSRGLSTEELLALIDDTVGEWRQHHAA